MIDYMMIMKPEYTCFMHSNSSNILVRNRRRKATAVISGFLCSCHCQDWGSREVPTRLRGSQVLAFLLRKCRR